MITDLYADVLPFLGKAGTATDAEIGLLNALLPVVEAAVKKFTGTSVESATHTHYLPTRGRGLEYSALSAQWDKVGGKVAPVRGVTPRAAERLILPEIPVTDVASVYEDASARGGQAESDFPASSLLAAGTDYRILQHESGMCRSGILVRIGAGWPARDGTVKVTYTAGWTAAQLHTGEASPIRLAVLLWLRRLFGRTGEAAGPVQSERLGDYSVTYAVADLNKGMPSECQSLLKPFVHWARKM